MTLKLNRVWGLLYALPMVLVAAGAAVSDLLGSCYALVVCATVIFVDYRIHRR